MKSNKKNSRNFYVLDKLSSIHYCRYVTDWDGPLLACGEQTIYNITGDRNKVTCKKCLEWLKQ